MVQGIQCEDICAAPICTLANTSYFVKCQNIIYVIALNLDIIPCKKSALPLLFYFFGDGGVGNFDLATVNCIPLSTHLFYSTYKLKTTSLHIFLSKGY